MKLPTGKVDLSRVDRLYPRDPNESYYWGESSYQPMIDDFGQVLVQVDDNDYQGDTRVAYFKDGKYGFLNFGWGSCSGCDALQACNSREETAELIEETERSIIWFDTLDELKAYITDELRKQSYYWHEDEWKEFADAVLALEAQP